MLLGSNGLILLLSVTTWWTVKANETTTMGNYILISDVKSVTLPDVTTTTTTATTTTKAPSTTTAAEPLILNGGLHPEDMARLLIQVEQQQPTFSYVSPAAYDVQLTERMNEKRSPYGGGSSSNGAAAGGVNYPSTVATYGSSVVNIPPVYGATFGQPTAAKGIGYNLGYNVVQSATNGDSSNHGGGGAGVSVGGGGLLGGFGRFIQMVGSGIKNMFNIFGSGNQGYNAGGGGYAGGGKSNGGGGVKAAVVDAGSNLKALGLGIGIGAIKGMILGTKIGLIKGLILAKIKQSLASSGTSLLQQKFQPPAPASYYPQNYDNIYRQDTGGDSYGYMPAREDDQGTYSKGDENGGYDSYAPPTNNNNNQDVYGRSNGGGGEANNYYSAPSDGHLQQQQMQQMGPSATFGNFALGAVAGAVKGAKDGIVRRIFSGGDIHGQSQPSYPQGPTRR